MLWAMCTCVQKRSTLLKWDLAIQEIQALVFRKKLILICKFGCVPIFLISAAIIRFQSALLDYSFLFCIFVCYIRLVYHTSNFQIVAIGLTSLVKDTFCLQLRQSNSKLVWLASKKRIKVLEQVTLSCINISFFKIFFSKFNFH